MKEQIHTIPISDAFASGDECPFCYMEREAQQRLLRLTLGAGASYMEPEMREVTTQYGFCRGHYKKMFDFSNALGNALIMQSYMAGLIEEMQYVRKEQRVPGKKGLFRKKEQSDDSLLTWAKQKQSTCYICSRLEEVMDRSYSTFFSLLKEEEFRQSVENCKGFCMEHFVQLLEHSQRKLPEKHSNWFYATIPDLMLQNMERVKEDLDWFAAKFDYRNAAADWKNSKDAVQRSMQKLRGGYPADPPYRDKGRP
jgi:hypothetical protein